MTKFIRVKSSIALVIFATVVSPLHTQADDYKWLESSDYNSIFVYENVESCNISEEQFTKSLEGAFLRSRIKAFISKDPPIVNAVRENGKHINFFTHELVKNKKVFLYVLTNCREYDSGYIYEININFAIIDDESGSIFLHASPNYGVVGVGDGEDIDTALRKLAEDAVASYISSNIKNGE